MAGREETGELHEAAEIAGLQLRRHRGLSLEHAPFAVLYALAGYYCFATFGLPYQLALAKAGLMEHEDGRDVDEFPLLPCQPLPYAYVPSFMARLALVAVILLHLLMLLAQRWSIAFKCFLKYPRATLQTAQFAQVTPPPHQGKSAMCPMGHSKTGEPCFTFQKFKFVYEPPRTNPLGLAKFRRVQSPSNLPLATYGAYTGLGEEQEGDLLDRFGPNKFEIVMPTFLDLYIEGLLSPFSVFQMFCILLWCLDEYWQYSVFTLFMMFVFEGTVVMSRRKNLQTLSGMNNEPRRLLVRRKGVWTRRSAEELLPGDVMSITRGSASGDDVVPCDCVVLKGSAVVNEATLTGESIPQMKEALVIDDTTAGISLDMELAHKVSILYGGTRLLQHKGVTAEEHRLCDENLQTRSFPSDIPSGTPDGGCLCVALRTGFESSQGKLVRMIEFSSEKVSGNTWEALGLVLFLLCFALVASGYVLKRGLEDGRDQFDLLLHCILIVTSVIPPELNMQLALAVNQSLLTLMKLHIFCTEPFRIPVAGKTDACLFDKTGTITTDELVADTVIGWSPSAPSAGPEPVAIHLAGMEASLVLAGCHSLVEIDGKNAGDPLEEASLKALRWEYTASQNTSRPLAKLKDQSIDRSWTKSQLPSVAIIHRHHFASKLQRMSVIASVARGGSKQLMVLAKGSPEVIGTLLRPEHTPAWYHETHSALAKKGMRVIALAFKTVAASEGSQQKLVDKPRSWAESDLSFAGFIAFRCLVRKDSAEIITGLKESSHFVAMITGDAILTAIHVASEVGITSADKSRILMLEDREGSGLTWVNALTDKVHGPFAAAELESLSTDYDLTMIGKTLEAATEAEPAAWNFMHCIKVFARMTPDRKAAVLTALKDNKHFTLMCGDGANDVGALKQAHVGIALLSGFGSANVDKKSVGAEQPESKDKGKDKGKVAAAAPAGVVAKTSTAVAAKKDDKPKLSKEELKKKQKEEMEAKQLQFQRNVEERQRKGESFATMREMYAFAQRERDTAMAAAKKKRAKMGGGGFAGHAAMLAAMEDGGDMDDGSVPMVKLGDASVASPFTSKKPSIGAAIDIIRQGRCTLVTTMQMYQILALNCLISSYSLSSLYLDGVKYGDRQMTAMGLLMTVSFLSISRATPLKKLSSVRPLNSIFHPAMFLSLIGQFAIHLGCMYYVVAMTKPYLPEDYEPSLEGKFEPNLINSVVFLVTCVQQVVVFVVNYKGHPFMNGLTENRFLIWSLSLCGVGAFVAASNMIPIFNKAFQLVEYPSDAYQSTFLAILVFNAMGTFLWDRLVLFLFARDIFLASVQSVTFKDIKGIAKVIGIVFLVIYFLSVEPPEDYYTDEAAAEPAAASAPA